ncbi:hypothetical protein AAY473_013896 [Plecturocebus cupreus]
MEMGLRRKEDPGQDPGQLATPTTPGTYPADRVSEGLPGKHLQPQQKCKMGCERQGMEGQRQEDTPRKESYRRNWGSSRLGSVFCSGTCVPACACPCMNEGEPLGCVCLYLVYVSGAGSVPAFGGAYAVSVAFGLFVYTCTYFSAYISVGSYIVEKNFFCFFAILPMKYGSPQHLSVFVDYVLFIENHPFQSGKKRKK